uniref:MFS domain-containing protein n=1 Tax=Angiostrongylus cantonensis TaxID=6313 RepID=A0A0K0DLW3_ANGCA
MYGAFTAITFFANITFAVIPSREIPNRIESRISKTEMTFHTEMALIGGIFVDKRMITLSPLFIYLGFYTSFWISVYPTSLMFTKSLSSHIYLPAFYSLAVGIGEVIMGTFISTMSKRVTDFGLKPAMFIAFGLTTILLLLIVFSVPPWATIELTNDPTLLIKPSDCNDSHVVPFEDNKNLISAYSVLLSTSFALLIGLTDSSVNNVRNVICALSLPEARAQSFAISKFYQVGSDNYKNFRVL